MQLSSRRPLIRGLAGLLAIASLWAAFQGPLDSSLLGLVINWAELIVGIVLAMAALGAKISIDRA